MKANHTSLFYITLLFIGGLSVSCSNQSKDKVAAFEDIRPDYKKKETTSRTNQDTLLPYLTKYINDSVGLVFDSIQLDQRLHFLDRFSNGKKPNRTHFELSNSSSKTFVGEWACGRVRRRVYLRAGGTSGHGWWAIGVVLRGESDGSYGLEAFGCVVSGDVA